MHMPHKEFNFECFTLTIIQFYLSIINKPFEKCLVKSDVKRVVRLDGSPWVSEGDVHSGTPLWIIVHVCFVKKYFPTQGAKDDIFNNIKTQRNPFKPAEACFKTSSPHYSSATTWEYQAYMSSHPCWLSEVEWIYLEDVFFNWMKVLPSCYCDF